MKFTREGRLPAAWQSLKNLETIQVASLLIKQAQKYSNLFFKYPSV